MPIGLTVRPGALGSGLKTEDSKFVRTGVVEIKHLNYLETLHNPLENGVHFSCFDSFSPTCHLDDGDEVVCDQCARGYSGTWCERYTVSLNCFKLH